MKTITPTLAICVLAVIAGIVAAVADLGANDSAPPAYGESPTLTISNFEFSAALVTPGATVAVKNLDGAPHTATADDNSFNSGVIQGGEDGSFVAPAEPGRYALHCDVHPTMVAELVVAGS